MRSIGKLFGAVGALADSILALSALVDTISGKLRLQLAHEVETPALAHEIVDEPAVNGASTAGRRSRKSEAQ